MARILHVSDWHVGATLYRAGRPVVRADVGVGAPGSLRSRWPSRR